MRNYIKKQECCLDLRSSVIGISYYYDDGNDSGTIGSLIKLSTVLIISSK